MDPDLLPSMALFVASLLAFIGSWLFLRKSSMVLPSDFFSMAVLILFGPAILVHPYEISSGSTITIGSEEAIPALYCLSFMYFTFSIVWSLRPRLYPQSLLNGNNPQIQGDVRIQAANSRIFYLAIAASMAIFIAFMAVHSFLDLKRQVFMFVTGRMGQGEYEHLRRVTDSEDPFLADVVSRLRFSLFTFFYCIIIGYLISKKRTVLAAVSAIIFYFALSSSLSKLPYVYYFGYFIMLWLLNNKIDLAFKIGNMVVLCVIAVFAVVAFVSVLLTRQYPSLYGFGHNFDGAIAAAVDRVLLDPYACLLRYFTVYPHMLPHMGWAGSKVVADLFKLQFRDPTVEVPMVTLSAEAKTTNPTIFISEGWAMAGYWGMAIATVLIGLWLMLLDRFVLWIRSPLLKAAYFAAICLNVTFLPQLGPLTALTTYGLAVIPALCLVVEEFLVPKPARAASAHAAPPWWRRGGSPVRPAALRRPAPAPRRLPARVRRDPNRT